MSSTRGAVGIRHGEHVDAAGQRRACVLDMLAQFIDDGYPERHRSGRHPFEVVYLEARWVRPI
jgi:hypothetical protein